MWRALILLNNLITGDLVGMINTEGEDAIWRHLLTDLKACLQEKLRRETQHSGNWSSIKLVLQHLNILISKLESWLKIHCEANRCW